MRHRTLTTIDVDGIEVELDSNPEYFEPITIQPTPDTLVVGYLLHDEFCSNPMKDYDCEGDLYTNPSRYAYDSSITDDKSAPRKLGLKEFGSHGYDPEYDLEFDEIDEQVALKLQAYTKADKDLSVWMVSNVVATGMSFEAVTRDLVVKIKDWGWDTPRLDWDSEEDERMIELLPSYENLAKTAWEDLYAEGKVGEYLAVPVYYAASVHGPGTTQIYTTSLDSANAVWVPNKCAVENMNFDGCVTYADKLKVAEKYAQGVLKQYESWCNGDCWGYVVESFVLKDGEYERVGDTDSCWGFIGQEWAEEALKEQMDYHVKKFKEKEAA